MGRRISALFSREPPMSDPTGPDATGSYYPSLTRKYVDGEDLAALPRRIRRLAEEKGVALPEDALESHRPCRRIAHSQGARGAGRAVRRLLVSDLRPDPSRGHGANAAPDLTQDYFGRLLEKGTVAAADPVKGRFRARFAAGVREEVAA